MVFMREDLSVVRVRMEIPDSRRLEIRRLAAKGSNNKKKNNSIRGILGLLQHKHNKILVHRNSYTHERAVADHRLGCYVER